VEEDRECGTVNVSRGSGGGGREGSWRCRWGFEGGKGVASWRRGGGEGTGLGWLRFSGRGATAAGPGGGSDETGVPREGEAVLRARAWPCMRED
jgi:hypothetical protein